MLHMELGQIKEPYLGQLTFNCSVRAPNFNDREREREEVLPKDNTHTYWAGTLTHIRTHNTLICTQLNSVSFNSFISDKLKV